MTDKARIAVEGELKGQKFRRVVVIDGSKGWIKLDDAVVPQHLGVF